MAQISNADLDKAWKPIDFETLTPTSAAALDATKAASADMVWISVVGGPATFRVDGAGDPTATTGIYLNSGDVARVVGSTAIKNVKVLSAAGTVSVTYFK